MNILKIRALDSDIGKFVYLGTDHSSGGYPYWDTDIEQANSYIDGSKEFNKDVQDIKLDFKKKRGYTYKTHLTNPTIVKINIVELKPIDIEDETIEEKRKRILEKLSDEELEILGIK